MQGKHKIWSGAQKASLQFQKLQRENQNGYLFCTKKDGLVMTAYNSIYDAGF